MTGMREQEVMHAYWSDVNFSHTTVRVSHKPDRGWTPKAYKEREIPIPATIGLRDDAIGIIRQAPSAMSGRSRSPCPAAISWNSE
jgi:hypothetical protein